MLDTWDLFNAKTTRGSAGSFFLLLRRPVCDLQPQTSPFRRVFMLLTANVENMKCYSLFFPEGEKKCVLYAFGLVSVGGYGASLSQCLL